MLGTGVEEENEQQPHSIRRRRHRDYDEEDDDQQAPSLVGFIFRVHQASRALRQSVSQSVTGGLSHARLYVVVLQEKMDVD